MTPWSKLNEHTLASLHPTFDAKARAALRVLERHRDGCIAADARDAHSMLAAGVDGVKLQRCSGCDAARYCGKECAKAGWKAGHREECKAAQLKKQQAKAG
ncbi:hypothetical protein MNEG_5374 [Monoraphidium neglectum]|uniref:MYND-type domain-containing protein n=1 Tax=Monoraphidium neglectum TaxID=145388 RepID=A0A0D2JUS4_9CHLO|nr:hypothetical protein MNEG_5374 [Monoraphidium neglectum]KIZ02583.1 hypothetical protein MNEG_5374 [Monoraphidium neglectum]|eukprot:XP_013901602.1 hypothetical protein MNEG_5374 [Monoraphidium neglectum]